MDKPINQCFICRNWFWEEVLDTAPMPDQVGHVQKPVCRKCLKEIEERSFMPESEKKKKLLMEDER